MAQRAGVRILVGSDPIFPMDEAIREFTALAKRIRDNWVVLRGGTIVSAELLGLEDQIGSLRPGKQADLVAAPASPIERMSSIEAIDFVMRGGRVVRDDRLD